MAGSAKVWALYRECLRLRAANSIFQSAPRSQWHVEKFDSAVAVRWHGADADWLLMVSVSDPATLQPPDVDGRWEFVLSSNEERFGGVGARKLVGPGAALWCARRAVS